jgi:cytochrome c oxidase subunit 3
LRSSILPAEQFDDLEQQREADTLGMWVFLATEIMFFGAVFLGFTVYRVRYPEAFSEAARHLKLWWGAVNTAVLLGSSLTVALAVHAAERGRNRQVLAFLLSTMALAVVFLSIKGAEYYAEYDERLVPGIRFEYQGPHARQVSLFLCFYFILTGIHATHMLIGLGIFAVISLLAFRGRFSEEYSMPVEISGLYWHFVDIVWIFLFPVLYLLRE